MPLSIGAALALHLLVLGSGGIGAQAVLPPAAAGALTVRLIEPPVRAPVAEQTPVQERSSQAAGATEAAAATPAGATEAAPAIEAAPAVASTLARPEVRPPRTLTPGPSTAAATVPADLLAATTPEPAPEQPAAVLPAAVAALPAAPAYLLGARLDPGPLPIGDIEPAYPESANLQEGKVVVRVLINDAGTVDNVAVVRSAPAGLFEEAALEAFGKARFSPGRVAGVAVKSQITVEVHFLPINRGSRISGRGY